MLFAAWVLNETITPYFLVGAVCILTGMYLANHTTQTEGEEVGKERGS